MQLWQYCVFYSAPDDERSGLLKRVEHICSF